MRSETAHRSILVAAAGLVKSIGFEKVSIESIASEAGVAKQTIYRWYPSKSAIVAECLAEGLLLSETFEVPDTGDVRRDLTSWLTAVFTYLSIDENAALMSSLLAAAVQEPEVSGRAARNLGALDPALAERLIRAYEAGELREHATPRLLGESIFGFIAVRILSRSAFEEDDAHALLALLLG